MTQKPPLSYNGSKSAKLEPDDIEGKTAILTVATARRTNFSARGDDWKIVLTFLEIPGKEYVANSTSYTTISDRLGDDEDLWIGKHIVMAPTTTTYAGKTYEKVHAAPPERWAKVVEQVKRQKKS